jgi:hypothetical protein
MKSIALSNGNVYFENTAKHIVKVSGVRKSTMDGLWSFVIRHVDADLCSFPSEEEANTERKKILDFLNQYENYGGAK